MREENGPDTLGVDFFPWLTALPGRIPAAVGVDNTKGTGLVEGARGDGELGDARWRGGEEEL